MEPKDTFFSNKRSLNCGGRLLSTYPPVIMGILNITPDSFYMGSRKMKPEEIRERAGLMIDEGATILDVGAYSSRPGASDISEQEEMERLEPALSALRESFPEIILSVDTFRAGIARKAVEGFGVDMVNDISGGDLDERMHETIAELGVPYVVMHMKGDPGNMQEMAVYEEVLNEVIQSISVKLDRLNRLGVKDVIIDPGFGFAKSIGHNFEILRGLEAFRILERPLLVGLSRKSMIYRTLGKDPEEALNGSTVLHTIALMKGASILRVHDVAEAREAITLVMKTFGNL